LWYKEDILRFTYAAFLCELASAVISFLIKSGLSVTYPIHMELSNEECSVCGGDMCMEVGIILRTRYNEPVVIALKWIASYHE
jgi:hypothetical protein